MKYVLLILAVVAGAFGALFFQVARGAVHEIQGLICFVGASVLLSGFAIVSAIQRGQVVQVEREVRYGQPAPRS